jgi:hypothetical protein
MKTSYHIAAQWALGVFKLLSMLGMPSRIALAEQSRPCELKHDPGTRETCSLQLGEELPNHASADKAELADVEEDETHLCFRSRWL